MFCKNGGKKYFMVLGFLGLISLVIGIIMTTRLNQGSHGADMAAGMLCGLGTCFIVIFLIRKFQERFAPEKIKKDEIEKNDERNIQVTRAAFTVLGTVAIIYMTGMTLAMAFMDFVVGTYISIAGIYVSAISFFIAYRIYQKKM